MGIKSNTFFNYDNFVKKFEQKKTTDDCYTPSDVYDAVKGWVCARYGVKEQRIVRPFWPGGDFERFDYPENCVVLDNPPFSILARIIDFYLENNVDFFLFGSALTAFNYLNNEKRKQRICVIPLCVNITYENGAKINTGFITTLEKNCCTWNAPQLYKILNDLEKAKARNTKQANKKYIYPPSLLTGAMMGKYSSRGVDFRVPAEKCLAVSELKQQKEKGLSVFGNGLLLSERLSAEKAAAEKAAAEKTAAEKTEQIKLSAIEQKLVKTLDSENKEELLALYEEYQRERKIKQDSVPSAQMELSAWEEA